MSVKEFLNLATSGGLVLLFFLSWNLVCFFGGQTEFLSRRAIVTLGALGAILIYQPHFVSTYWLNYSRGIDFIKSHFLSLVLFPILFFTCSIGLLLYGGTEPIFYSGLYSVIFLWGLWHFSAQSVAVTMLMNETGGLNPFILRLLFFFTALIGSGWMVRDHASVFDFFGIRPIFIESLTLPFDSVARWMLVSQLGGVLFLVVTKRMRFQGSLPWVAWLLFFGTETFTKDFFYLIPTFHALQYFPFYLKQSQRQKTSPNLGWILLISLALVFILPNLIQNALQISFEQSAFPFFAMVLLFFNSHHFLMENYTFRSLANKKHFDGVS